MFAWQPGAVGESRVPERSRGLHAGAGLRLFAGDREEPGLAGAGAAAGERGERGLDRAGHYPKEELHRGGHRDNYGHHRGWWVLLSGVGWGAVDVTATFRLRNCLHKANVDVIIQVRKKTVALILGTKTREVFQEMVKASWCGILAALTLLLEARWSSTGCLLAREPQSWSNVMLHLTSHLRIATLAISLHHYPRSFPPSILLVAKLISLTCGPGRKFCHKCIELTSRRI